MSRIYILHVTALQVFLYTKFSFLNKLEKEIGQGRGEYGKKGPQSNQTISSPDRRASILMSCRRGSENIKPVLLFLFGQFHRMAFTGSK